MADKRKTPDSAEAARRAKRGATIDLTATDVTPAAESGGESRFAAESEPETQAKPAAAPDSSEPKPDLSSDPKPEPDQTPIWQPPVVEPKPVPVEEPNPVEQPKPVEQPPADLPPAQEPPPVIDEPPPSETAAPDANYSAPREAAPARRSSLPLIAAGSAGGAVTALAIAAVWYAGLLPAPERAVAPAAPDGQTVAQIAALEKQVRDLQNRPAPSPSTASSADTKAVEALGQRLGKIESALATLPAGDGAAAEKLAAADNAVKSLGVALAALTKRSDDTAATAAAARQRADEAEKAVGTVRAGLADVAKTAAAGVPSADIDALQQRLAALEQATKEARSEIAKTAAADSAARRALSATALQGAVVSGAPYADALAQVKSLGVDAKAVAPLEPFAASGVPSAATLIAELNAALPAMTKVTAPAPTGGFLERLEANASRLVRIRPVDAPAGDDAAAVIARVEAAAAKADIAAAVTELGKLDAAARAPAQGFLDKAAARQAALAAARRLVADTSLALGQK